MKVIEKMPTSCTNDAMKIEFEIQEKRNIWTKCEYHMPSRWQVDNIVNSPLKVLSESGYIAYQKKNKKLQQYYHRFVKQVQSYNFVLQRGSFLNNPKVPRVKLISREIARFGSIYWQAESSVYVSSEMKVVIL